MLRYAIFLAGIMTSPLVAADQAAQFDLRCKGAFTNETVVKTTSEPYEAIYRVDLDAKRWCEAECKAIHQIVEVQPASIILQSKHGDDLDPNSVLTNEIDRETGAHHIFSSSRIRSIGAMTLTWDGNCEREPFSGFPSLQTKF